MTYLQEYLQLLAKKEAATKYQSFLSESSFGGLSDFNSPSPTEFTEEDENRLYELKRKLEDID